MNKASRNPSSFFSRLLYFFPLQLLFVHIKKNQQLLLFWLLLFLAIFNQIGVKYGLPYLFLAPEYLGKLSFSSYLIVGFAFGGFAIAFNISSYIMNGFRFPFLATLSKPFLKYAINNSIIPLAFIVCYLIQAYSFLSHSENLIPSEIFSRLAGFLGGYILFTLFSMSYFLATNKDFEKLFGRELAKVLNSDTSGNEPAKILLNKKETDWYAQNNFDKAWRVDAYIDGSFRLKLTRSFQHYDQNMLSQVFRQNHINASFFELVVLVSIIVLGLFRENELFIIPAGATIILVFTMLLMIASALRSWIRGWTVVVLILVLVLFNQISKYDDFYYNSRAYGLDYSKNVNYSGLNTTDDKQMKLDYQMSIDRLEEWKKRNPIVNGKKPKAVFLASSGGGARAAFWSFLALQHLDSVTDGALMRHSIMGTGSSGGMIGTAYFRELKRRQIEEGLNPYNSIYRSDLSKDILNPIMFTFAVNDVLIRTKKFEFKGESYWKDRGFVFEKTLHENTRNLFLNSLGDYRSAEKKAMIPTLIFTPSIVNDSRRLLISTLPLSFMCSSNDGGLKSENVDYITLFRENDPLSIRFSTVLRMNASFPYIMPTISLPTDPKIEVFDSGLRDNYGIKTALKYIFNLREWLEANTSGIVILQIRDGLKEIKGKDSPKSQSIVNELLSPFGSLYGNWFEVQDYNNDELVEYTKEWYNGEVSLINYELNKSPENYISLSWHLTSKEKEQVVNSVYLEANQKAEKQLKQILK